ncbi:MAG: OmpA family protein [Melioribacter sp.]|nr:OmpA family protein [Melioribacter sp.]
MKKISLLLFFMIVVSDISKAQLAKDSWSFSFGVRYPRFVSINLTTRDVNYGGFLSLQRNFSEHVGLRLKGAFSHIESEYLNPVSVLTTESTNAITGDLDLLFYFVPCEPVSPYLFGGFGGVYKMLRNKATIGLEDNTFNYELNAGAGLEWDLDTDWRLVTEFGYHITNNSEFDGAPGVGEINGRDTYMSIDLGLLYFIDKGETSRLCQLYFGISQEYKDMTDYDRIEEMIKKHIPREVTKEVVVERPPTSVSEKWVLVGVNFDFNRSKFTPESYPILYDAAKTLLKNPDLKAEIQGFTDNIGAEGYNKKLSQKRADIVKNYLISKGISANRLNAVGYGEVNPVADNKTSDGRAMNRRIEFKVQ